MQRWLILFAFLLFSLPQAQDDLLIGGWIAGDTQSTLSFSFARNSEVSIRIVDSSEDITYTGLWFLDESSLIIGLDGEELIYEVLSLSQTELVLSGGGLDEPLYLTPLTSNATQPPGVPAQPTNPLGQQNNPEDLFSGLFAGQDISLELNPAASSYEGILTFQGQSYPAQAQAQGNRLSGFFVAGGQNYNFDASLSGTNLILKSGGSSYQLQKQLSQSPLNPAPTTPSSSANQASASNADGLIGKWRYRSEEEFLIEDESIYFLPDGRYFTILTSQVPGYDADVSHEEGFYYYTEQQITFQPFCNVKKQFKLELQGKQYLLSGQDILGEPFSYTYLFEAGKDEVVAEIRTLDAQREQENQAYLARTPVGPVQQGPFTEPGLPVDPNPGNINPSTNIFTEGELYTYLSEWTYVFDIYGQLQSVNTADIVFNTEKMATLDYSQGSYRDTVQWFFLPNGRYYSLTELYGLALSTNPLTPQTTAFWGKYHLEGDKLILQDDTGNISEYIFLDGRRAFAALEDGICYKEVTWATEQLEQQTNEPGN